MKLDLLLSLVSVAHDLCEILATKPLTASEIVTVAVAHETLTKIKKSFDEMKTVQPQSLPVAFTQMEAQLAEAEALLNQIHREAYAEYRRPVHGGVGVGVYQRFWQSIEPYIRKHHPERVVAKSPVLGMPYGSDQAKPDGYVTEQTQGAGS